MEQADAQFNFVLAQVKNHEICLLFAFNSQFQNSSNYSNTQKKLECNPEIWEYLQ